MLSLSTSRWGMARLLLISIPVFCGGSSENNLPESPSSCVCVTIMIDFNNMVLSNVENPQ